MAETGWPLIPREVLPAPVPPAARNRRPQRAALPDSGRQLSIFGAETTEPSPLDLAGLAAGPGRLDRMGGTARVAVTVESAWRVHVLVSELVSRGLVVHWRPLRPHLQDQDEIRRMPSPPESGAHPPTGGDGANPIPSPGPAASLLHPDADLADGPDFADFTGDPALEDGGGVIGRGKAAGEADPPARGGRDGAGQDGDGSGDDGVRAGDVPVPRYDGAASSLDGSPAEVGDGSVDHGQPAPVLFEVRTAYSSRLNGLARAWPEAAGQLFLGGLRLRLWVAAAGRPIDGGYALGLGEHDPATWPAVDAALRRAGLDGVLSDHGLDYLITGRKRLARLAELVGERPDAAPVELWPGGPAA